MELKIRPLTQEEFNTKIENAEKLCKKACGFLSSYTVRFNKIEDQDFLLFYAVNVLFNNPPKSRSFEKVLSKWKIEFEKRFNRSDMVSVPYELAKTGIVVTHDSSLYGRGKINYTTKILNLTNEDFFESKRGLFVEIMSFRQDAVDFNNPFRPTTKNLVFFENVRGVMQVHNWIDMYALTTTVKNSKVDNVDFYSRNFVSRDRSLQRQELIQDAKDIIEWHARIHNMTMYGYSLGYAEHLDHVASFGSSAKSIVPYLEYFVSPALIETALMVTDNAEDMVNFTMNHNMIKIQEETLPELEF